MIIINEARGGTPRSDPASAMLALADRGRAARAAERRSDSSGDRAEPGSRAAAREGSFLHRLLIVSHEVDIDLHDWLEAWGMGTLGEGGAASLRLRCDGVRVGGLTRRVTLTLVDEIVRAARATCSAGRIHVAVLADLLGPALLVRIEVLASALSPIACGRALAEVETLATMAGVTMVIDVGRDRAVVELALPARPGPAGNADLEVAR